MNDDAAIVLLEAYKILEVILLTEDRVEGGNEN